MEMFGCGPERCTSDHSQLPPRVQYSGSAIRDCSGDSKPQSGAVCSGGRLPLASCRLDIATAALNSAKGVQHEHSESGAGPDSISDIARSNPGDVLAIAAFQRPLRELPINFR